MNGADKLAGALFGKSRRALLALFFSHEGEAFYLRQIVRAVSMGQGAVQRELARLTEAGLICRTRQGNQVFYQANRICPIFPEVKSLVAKTVGASEVLRRALHRLSHRIEIAFLYGSSVTGTLRPASDVDLMVIGPVTFAEVAEAIRPAQESLRREINPSVYSLKEFRGKVKAGHHFLKALVKAPKVLLMGDEHVLKRMGA